MSLDDFFVSFFVEAVVFFLKIFEAIQSLLPFDGFGVCGVDNSSAGLAPHLCS